jgi:hypothetical protein
MFFLASFLLFATGFVVNQMWVHVIPASAGLLFGIVALASLMAIAAAYFTRCSLANASALVWLIALTCFVGVSACMSVALIAVAAMGLGSLFVPADWSGRAELSLLCGLALVCGVLGWLLPYQVHYRLTYVPALLLIALLRWKALVPMLRALPTGWKSAVAEAPAVAWLAVTTLGAVSVWAWSPVSNYDDLAYHLALPSQLASLGYYQMSAGSSLWAVAAWGGDVLQGLAWVVAGGESTGAVNVMWLLATAGLMWQFCKALQVVPWARWFAIALYVSMPISAGLLASMHTEGPTAAVAIGLALIIQRSAGSSYRELLAVALLLGLLLALKISNLMIAGPLGLWLLCKWRARLPWRAMVPALLLVIVSAGSSYFYAYVLTGNPVLPVFNGYFRSPYYRLGNFHDTHWDTGLHWTMLWDLVFHTSRYIEDTDGAEGFIPLALAGSVLVAAFNRISRPAALVAVAAFVLPLTQIQYLRYAHPALVLLIPVALCGLPISARARFGVWPVKAALVLLVTINLAFLSAPRLLWNFLSTDHRSFMEQSAPMRRMAEVVKNRYNSQARVLITSTSVPFAASFAGTAFVVNWYDQQLSTLATAANRDDSGELWSKLFKLTGANLVLLEQGDVSVGLRTALSKYRASPSYALGNVGLWELHGGGAGESTHAPANNLSVRFDVSSSPPAEVLIDAAVVLQCEPSDKTLVVGWNWSLEGGQSLSSYGWRTCDVSGHSHLSFDVKTARRLTALSVSVVPRDGSDMGLSVLSSQATLRPDFTAERDLASQWPGKTISEIKILSEIKAANTRRLKRYRAKRAQSGK